MSEIIDNNRKRVDNLKKLLLDLHNGKSLEETRKKLLETLGNIPYGEVVQAEQELIEEGLPSEEIQKFCDVHSQAMKGNLDHSHLKSFEPGHPVHTFIMENRELQNVINDLKKISTAVNSNIKIEKVNILLNQIHAMFNSLMDIEKHFIRKENLVFSIMERHNITGPPKVMWGKDNEVRDFLKSSIGVFESAQDITKEEIKGFFELLFNPTFSTIEEMIYKEENILFPMCLDTFTNLEWYEIYKQSDEIGYCLYDPITKWQPENIKIEETQPAADNSIRLSTGSFKNDELDAVFKTLPFDLTFVDKDDKVRYFSLGEERIFSRSRAILGRQVQYCHPPSSVHIVEQILNDFKTKKQDKASFWINFHEKLVMITYYAVRNENGDYLGTLEVTQDITGIKKIEGERRLLTYSEQKEI
jgi:uncharacterized protein